MKNKMTIAEVANLLQISPSTLRYYEDQGLISPKRENDSGYRYYDNSELAKLTDILLFKKTWPKFR